MHFATVDPLATITTVNNAEAPLRNFTISIATLHTFRQPPTVKPSQGDARARCPAPRVLTFSRQMSSGRSPEKDDPKGRNPGRPSLDVDTRPSSSHKRVSPSPASAGGRPQWATGRKRSRSSSDRRGTGDPDTPGVDELSDRSSDDSDEDSDELEETGDDTTERRELSSSFVGDTLDISGKEL